MSAGPDRRLVRKVVGYVELYDVWPSKPELHERHFFQLAPVELSLPRQWSAGEEHPSNGGATQRWTCRWMPLEQAHVLCAGFGAKHGSISVDHR